ncbi:TetR/AcrR family transcriptional regulator [Microbacterium flavescens]|uniref:TetR/AcrR family transcriptional regulator n=1 Tax=Microbacterium flavescens TaxID=69366 RepID=UPI001BDE2645|nr:TetR/AcrR family transcriptional regulator [Microbacterium flavescens]BFF10074.1 TetR/AcrR family transcriptional regulator C-terminal domain-containing protein [Microbacterium flavescens]
MPETEATPPRTRRRRSSLTVEAILDAAEIVAARGFESVTIRAVAAELGSSPMALYRYFTTKDELIDALLNRMLGRFTASPPTGDWIADLRAFALDHRRLLSDHRWAITPLTVNPNPGSNALPIGEAALRILHRAGIDGDEAVATFSGLIALNYGWASFVAGRQRGREADHHAVDAPLAQATSEFPLTVAAAESMSRYGSDAHYDIVLGQFVAGIAAGANSPRT